MPFDDSIPNPFSSVPGAQQTRLGRLVLGSRFISGGGSSIYFTNLSFEVADSDTTQPGKPDSWTWTHGGPLDFAVFASDATPATYSRFEGFETGWSNTPFADALTLGQNASAAAPTPIETFERGWRLPNPIAPDGTHPGNETAEFSLAGAESAEFSAGTPNESTDEGFETGWENDAYETAFASGDCVAGSTDDFESGWFTGTYETAFAGGDLEAGIFKPGSLGIAAHAYEDFETVLAPIAVRPDFTDSYFYAPGYAFNPFDAVIFSSDPTNPSGRLPAGLDPTLTYYVSTVDADNFQVVPASTGGPIVGFTDNGVGSITASADPTKFWTLTDVGV